MYITICTYLDKIDEGSLHLFNIVVIILLYASDVAMLLESRVSFQKLLNKLGEFCISCHLVVNLSKTKVMIFGRNRKKLNQGGFYLGNDQIVTTHE
jgi:hypothetical protein